MTRQTGKPDRRKAVRLPLRRLDDRTAARIVAAVRERMTGDTFIDLRGIPSGAALMGKVTK